VEVHFPHCDIASVVIADFGDVPDEHARTFYEVGNTQRADLSSCLGFKHVKDHVLRRDEVTEHCYEEAGSKELKAVTGHMLQDRKNACVRLDRLPCAVSHMEFRGGGAWHGGDRRT
jgi:hypothetical protein